MSYNNELYIFSEVPGYDASKGEPGIVKAFQKLREKIEYLEQLRISEKNASLQKAHSNSDSDITITDVQSEILLTQIRYIIKVIKEYANDKPSSLEVKNDAFKEVQEPIPPLSNYLESSAKSVDNGRSNPKETTQTETMVVDSDSIVETRQDQSSYLDVIACGQSLPEQKISSDTGVRVSHKTTKLNSQSHYHLKLDDVPFILGASSSASHSVVANVQNIIAMMKSHNRALCAPKQPIRSRTSSTSHVNKSETGDANEMIRQLSEELSNLAQKQEKLKEMFDNPQPSRYEKSKSEVKSIGENSSKSKGKNQSTVENSATGKSMLPGLRAKDNKQSKKKHGEVCEASQKHSVMSIRMQSNNNPQLARRKMLRSLKDFKAHLSEQDISWE